MGMYDSLTFSCPQCRHTIYSQLKIRRTPLMADWVEGSPISVDEIFPEYHRILLSHDMDRCPSCLSAFILDFTSGRIQIEVWDGKEMLPNPTLDYFHEMDVMLRIYEGMESGDQAVRNVIQLACFLQDWDILWFY